MVHWKTTTDESGRRDASRGSWKRIRFSQRIMKNDTPLTDQNKLNPDQAALFDDMNVSFSLQGIM
jgi:hypothetical protein